jgi:hypothetical protein
VYCYTNHVAATTVLIVPQLYYRKKRVFLVTQIMWPQQVYIVPKTLGLKKGGLLLHKLIARNRQTDRRIVPQLSGRKTSRLSVTQKKKLAATSVVNVPKFLATKQVALLLHK